MTGTTLLCKVLKRMSDTAFRKGTRGTVLVIGTFYLISGIGLLVGQ